ncbi:MAG: response regulator [bacterium]|nr:response regulator [bacterium]
MTRKTDQELLQRIKELEHENSMLKEAGNAATVKSAEDSHRVANLGTYSLDISSGLWTSSDILDKIFGINDQSIVRNLEVWSSILHPQDRKEMLDYFQSHVLAKGNKFNKDYRIIRMDDGQERWAHGHGELVLDENKNPVKMIGTILDITDRKLAEEELRQSKEAAEEATKLKDKFINLVVHDLISPFTSMLGTMSILRDDSKLNLSEPQRELLNDALENGVGMVSMIRGMLDIGKLKMGKIELKREFFDGQLISERTLKSISFTANEKGIKLVNEVPEGMRLYADKTLFTQVIANLVYNAVKFCSKGNTITLFVPEERPTTIAIKDDGPGIDASMLQNLFDSEIKTSTPGTSLETGSGLGLPFSHSVMQAHSGNLTVESGMGEGCLFYAELPFIKPRILVVDDEKNIRRSMAIFLTYLETDVMEAENGREALEMVKENEPHLIVSDIMMPFMDGFDLLKEIKENDKTRSIPVIIATGAGDMKTKERIIRMGADDFVAKPFSEEDFIPRIKKFII